MEVIDLTNSQDSGCTNSKERYQTFYLMKWTDSGFVDYSKQWLAHSFDSIGLMNNYS